MIHLIYIPFTGVGKRQYGGDEWFKERIEIFKNHTLKSLTNQKNKNFILWCSFREEEKSNPLTRELAFLIAKTGLSNVFTFNGLMYHDDKNEERNKTLLKRMGTSLRQVKEFLSAKFSQEIFSDSFVDMDQFDTILMTRIDSDDMFSKEAIDTIQNFGIDMVYGSLLAWRGFIYNMDTRELAEWLPRTNPPFHTIVFQSEIFFDAKEHFDYYERWRSHEDTPLFFTPVKFLPNNLYCVVVHKPKNHISTNWNHVFRGEPVDRNLIKNFGL